MTTESFGVVAAIPARWGSTRFPGKALADLAGEPMIAHVVRRALAAATVDHVLVATDDRRVAAAAEAAGAEAVMTGEHPSGTDRVAAAVSEGSGWELIVNIQGDEPLLSGANIDTLVTGMRRDPEYGMATLCFELPAARVADANAVKVVRDARRRALYIYGFRPETLGRFVSLPPSALERSEGLEQLRALENGIDVLVLDAPDPAFGVDTPEDLEQVERLLTRGD